MQARPAARPGGMQKGTCRPGRSAGAPSAHPAMRNSPSDGATDDAAPLPPMPSTPSPLSLPQYPIAFACAFRFCPHPRYPRPSTPSPFTWRPLQSRLSPLSGRYLDLTAHRPESGRARVRLAAHGAMGGVRSGPKRCSGRFCPVRAVGGGSRRGDTDRGERASGGERVEVEGEGEGEGPSDEGEGQGVEGVEGRGVALTLPRPSRAAPVPRGAGPSGDRSERRPVSYDPPGPAPGGGAPSLTGSHVSGVSGMGRDRRARIGTPTTRAPPTKCWRYQLPR